MSLLKFQGLLIYCKVILSFFFLIRILDRCTFGFFAGLFILCLIVRLAKVRKSSGVGAERVVICVKVAPKITVDN